jgi:predicted ATPase
MLAILIRVASMEDVATNPFANGSQWLRADFHLHTKADKEFSYDGEENMFVAAYAERLKAAQIGIGIIANHNKFNVDEFKALRKKTRKEGIGLLPGVELSVSDGAKGVHTLIVFSESWIGGGHDYINQFLTNAVTGKTKEQYEHENGRTNDNLLETLKKLEAYNRDFFIVFAHVESANGLWQELDGGRLTELAAHPLIQKYCLGFQKVRTHDKQDAKCRVKVQQWWPHYPAEVEGSDPKKLDEIGRGRSCFLKVGDFSFDAVKFALKDFTFRVAVQVPKIRHSHVVSIRFEGGLLQGVRVPFSPHMNCLIGIQGSGKSSVLECLRFALNIPFGEKAQDKDYKSELVPYVLKSGGKVIVEAVDRHGTRYDIHRILDHAPDVYVGGVLRPGVSIRETVVTKPLYFGQKDLSAAGKDFGQDLVEKLVGESLKTVRQKIAAESGVLKTAAKSLIALQSDVEEKQARDSELEDTKFRLEQFDKHGVKETLEKQVEFQRDGAVCESVDGAAEEWRAALEGVIMDAEESLNDISIPESKANAAFFEKYEAKFARLKKTVADAKAVLVSVEKSQEDLSLLRKELAGIANSLKDEFAQTERDLVKALADQGVTSIQPNAYVTLTKRRTELEGEIADLDKKTSKEAARCDAVLQTVASLNDLWLEEFKQVATALAKINAAQKALRVEAKFKEDKAAFQAKIEEICRGSGIRKEAYQALATGYADFAAIYKDLDAASKLTKAKADAFQQLMIENLADALTYQVPNSFDVTYHGKPLKSHSLGQRASAMMLFLLSQDEHDLLLVDQPEDDLDSQTVYEEVVKLVRNIKAHRQFIFATHNANFPVLGDSEIVAACAATDSAIEVAAGSIDTRECQSEIVSIMEGGVEAFERRKTIYELWHAQQRA